jgi:type I restriction enzyme S subunit
MKYKLKDLCSLTKGVTGIMKADGGKYPLVALSDERRSHSEFQFEAKAVIVPLISSTGHGHASMKRVHYQEGKFALGNILCAVIPNDETQLNAKYLHLYLQQFKETLLVPLMKGAANVSLPINKLADVEIEVPSLERQLEIIELAEEAAQFKNELEERLVAQDCDVTKLRQALLREAIQGKLTKQDVKDGNAKNLLKAVKEEKEQLIAENKIKREKELPSIREDAIPFRIPTNWAWCRLDDIFLFTNGKAHEQFVCENGKYILINSKFVSTSGETRKYSSEILTPLFINDLAIVMSDVPNGRALGRVFLVDNNETYTLNQRIGSLSVLGNLNPKYLAIVIDRNNHFLSFDDGKKQTNLKKEQITSCPIPLPPLLEQERIVKRIEQLMQLCDELQFSIQQSKIENEKLLQGALRDALKTEEVEV